MTELLVTFCDYCNPNADTHPLNGRGYVETSEEMAIKEFDWIRTDKGIKCIGCQEEEAA